MVLINFFKFSNQHPKTTHSQAFPLSRTTNKTKKIKLNLFKEITKNVRVDMTNYKQ